jgi:uncharacterized protein (DUF1800 family)
MLKPVSAKQWGFEAAAHLLNRAAFGGTPTEIESLARLSPSEAIDRILSPADQRAADPLPPPDWARPDPDRPRKLKEFREATPEVRRELAKARQKEERTRFLELQSWWLHRMAQADPAYAHREKLTLFWHGHFATAFQKVRDAYLMWRQNDLLRRLGGGDWTTLLREVSRDPAMLIWLDQAQSKPEHPNENFARELMELFTLGEGHYTESDVLTAARAMTGLTLDRFKQEPVFRPRLHDHTTTTLFGNTGAHQLDDVLRLIVTRPDSSRFITGRLWSFFAGTEASPKLIADLASAFEGHDRRFTPFLRTMLLSEAFHAPDVVRHQIKAPVQLLVTACRQLERDLPPPSATFTALRMLGQELYNPPNVKGWEGGVAWINTNTLLTRHNLALLLTTGENPLPAQPRNPKAPARPGPGRGAGRAAAPLQAARLFSEADFGSPDTLLSAIERRLLNAPFNPRDRAALKNHLNPANLRDPAQLLEVLRLGLCTAEYQLA